MGSACYSQIQTQTFSDDVIFLPISDEKKPNTINKGLKHDLSAKYNEITCCCAHQPETKDQAIQTCLSFQNQRDNSTNKKSVEKSRKHRKKQNSSQSKRHSNSVSQSTTFGCQDVFSKQSPKGIQSKEKYVIMINSNELKMKSQPLQLCEFY